MVDASNRRDVQDPNRITDISTYLSIESSLKNLERYINSLTRTLTTNERRLQQTLPGTIQTFERIKSEYAETGKLSRDQAEDLKTMFRFSKSLLKDLNDLSQFNAAGKAKNKRDDDSFRSYAKVLGDILEKMASSMEKMYSETAAYVESVNKVKDKFGLPSTVGTSGTPPATSQVTASVLKASVSQDKKIIDILNSYKKIFAKSILTPQKYAHYGQNAPPYTPTQLDDVWFKQFSKKYSAIGGPATVPNASILERLYAGDLLAPTARAFAGILKNIPILGALSKSGSSIASGAQSINFLGDSFINRFGEKGALGKAGKLLAGPIGASIGAIATAVGLIYAQMKKSSPILQAVSSIFELAWNLLWMPLGNALGTILLPMAEWLIDFAIAFNRIFTDFSLDALMDLGYSLWQVIWGSIVQLGNALPNMIMNALLDNAVSFFQSVGLDGAAKFFEDLKETYNNIYNFILNLPTKIGDMIKGVWDTIKSWIIEAYKGLFDFFSDPVKAIKDAVSSIFTGGLGGAAKDGAKGIWNNTVGEWTGIKLASGGIVSSPTIALVGEAGPEAVIPLDEMSRMGATYVVNINGDVYGVNDLESRIERVIQRTANKGYYR